MNTFFSTYLFWIAYGISNLAAILLMIACYKRPVVARFGFAMLFGWASWFNATTVLETPWAYTDFADYALLGYRWFILGPFQKQVTPILLSIALGQLLIAVSMLLPGRLFKIGCLGGLLFSVAILPLGLGSAFPAMAFLAIGFYRLYQHPAGQLLWKRPASQPTYQKRHVILMRAKTRLTAIKLIHTTIWLFFNVVIFYLLYAVIWDKIDAWVWVCIGLIGLEALTLLVFRWVCPLTLLARRYSTSRQANFDIYLPNWLARYNKEIYSVLVLIALLVLGCRFVRAPF